MFLEHFTRARDYLEEQGLKPALVMRSPVSESDLKALDAETDFPMPPELRQFYLEVGSGFQFVPDESDDSELIGWEPMYLDDHKIHNQGFGGAIEEDATVALRAKSPRSDPALLKQEMERRKRWMPFCGFIGGGDTLCLDLSATPPTVRFYESLIWARVPQTWDFVLASSFTEFFERWSRYHFLSPEKVAWTSFCAGGRSGQFDWVPEHFPRVGGEDR